MQYLALIYMTAPSADAPPPDDVAATLKPWDDYAAWLTEQGVPVVGEALHLPHTATTLRREGGQVVTHDGPFAETKEVLGGYYLFDCDDLDEALRLAGRIPILEMGGSVEVRPIMDYQAQRGGQPG